MGAPWTSEEIAWARECFLAGDTIEEIAEWASREVRDVVGAIGTGRNLSPRNREILSLYMCGCSFGQIAQERGGSAKAAAATLTHLRRQGLRIPHRNPLIAEAKGQRGIAA